MTFSESVNQKARVVHGCLLRLRWHLPRSPPPGVRSSKMSFYRFPQLQHGGHVEKHPFKEKERATQAKQCGVNFRVGWLVLGYRHLFSANSGSNISTGLLNWTLKQLYGLVAHWWFSWVTSDLDTVIVIIIFPWRKITKNCTPELVLGCTRIHTRVPFYRFCGCILYVLNVPRSHILSIKVEVEIKYTYVQMCSMMI